jgi:ribonuclease P protein component
MSPAVYRLKRRPEFLRVAATRRRWVSPGLILQARRHAKGENRNSEEPHVRVGFTVSRKVGNAVARNRARRRLRAAADLVIPAHARVGYDFVVIGRAGTLTRRFDALVGDLRTALKKLDAFTPEPDAR